MGCCSEGKVEACIRSVPEFNRRLVRSGTRQGRPWFSITDDPLKPWKPNQMDRESSRRRQHCTQARGAMPEHTPIRVAPGWVVQAVDKPPG